MKIQLTVINAPAGSPLAGQLISLGNGESIGRAADNSAILPDEERVISSKHAQVLCQEGQSILVDLSTNGTFLNNSPEAIGRGNTTPIKTGDLIAIGQYQFSIQVNETSSLPTGLEPVGFLDTTPPQPNTGSAASAMSAQSMDTTPPFAEPAAPSTPAADNSDDDFDEWLRPTATPQSSDPWGSSSSTTPPGHDPMSGIMEKPVTDPLAAFAPKETGSFLDNHNDDDNWWQTEADNAPADQMAMPKVRIQPEAQPAPPPPQQQTAVPVPPPPTPTAQNPVLNPALDVTSQNPSLQAAELAELMGLKGLSAEQEAHLLESCATIMHCTAQNLVGLLQARASIKNELRASRTIIQTEENNPLKFSAGAEDALKAMFANNSSAFLSPERAVQESFEDLADHQVAVLYAMKAAFNDMLSQFRPDKLESKFGSRNKGMLSGFTTKTWERYSKYYEQLQSDNENSYNLLFGEAFAEAYEAKQLELKSNRSLHRR